MASTGELTRMARGIWIASEADLAARCAAVLARASADAVISSVTAARLHGLWLPQTDDAIHVATAAPQAKGRTMTRMQRREFVAHRLELGDGDVTTIEGMPVTSPARTWRDLAQTLSFADLIAAGDSVLRCGTSATELREVVRQAAHARGVLALRRAVELLDARSRSRPESHLRAIIHEAGLRGYQVNEPIFRDEGGWLAEPDISLPEAKLALEYQGAEHAAVDRMRKDITRERDMRLDDWRVLYFGPAEVFGRPWSVGAEVRALFRARTRRR